GHLPPAHVDRLEPRLHLLNRLVARDGGQHGDVIVVLEQLPQAGRAVPGERVFDVDRAPQAVHVARRIRSRDAPPAGPRLPRVLERGGELFLIDRKSTRLNSSHVSISYAVFCLKKKNITYTTIRMILLRL